MYHACIHILYETFSMTYDTYLDFFWVMHELSMIQATFTAKPLASLLLVALVLLLHAHCSDAATKVTNKDFPPSALTADSCYTATTCSLSNQGHGDGAYRVTTSSADSRWFFSQKNLFDKQTENNAGYLGQWSEGSYSTCTGSSCTYSGASYIVSTHKGEYVQLQLPLKIQLDRVSIYGSTALDYRVYGSNDGTSWHAGAISAVSVTDAGYGYSTTNLPSLTFTNPGGTGSGGAFNLKVGAALAETLKLLSVSVLHGGIGYTDGGASLTFTMTGCTVTGTPFAGTVASTKITGITFTAGAVTACSDAAVLTVGDSTSATEAGSSFALSILQTSTDDVGKILSVVVNSRGSGYAVGTSATLNTPSGGIAGSLAIETSAVEVQTAATYTTSGTTTVNHLTVSTSVSFKYFAIVVSKVTGSTLNMRELVLRGGYCPVNSYQDATGACVDCALGSAAVCSTHRVNVIRCLFELHYCWTRF
jgi:hypothetical protein